MFMATLLAKTEALERSKGKYNFLHRSLWALITQNGLSYLPGRWRERQLHHTKPIWK